MSPISILLIGFAMSTDAFAAAIGKGAAMRKPVFRDALRAGIIFGVIEAITPIIGWLLGRAALQYVEAFDHWIAFGLLGAGLNGRGTAANQFSESPLVSIRRVPGSPARM